MKARVAASFVLAAGVILGTAGCNLLAPQDTTQIQTSSVGVQGQVGDVAIRDAVLVSNGTDANLVATFVNESAQPVSVDVAPASDTAAAQSVNVPANGTTVVSDSTAVQFNDVSAALGSLYPIYFTYTGGEGTTVSLPVVTGELAMFSTLTPTPAAG